MRLRNSELCSCTPNSVSRVYVSHDLVLALPIQLAQLRTLSAVACGQWLTHSKSHESGKVTPMLLVGYKLICLSSIGISYMIRDSLFTLSAVLTVSDFKVP